jgi:hypothetical protein
MKVGDLLKDKDEYALVLENRSGYVRLYWFRTQQEVWDNEQALRTYVEVIQKRTKNDLPM